MWIIGQAKFTENFNKFNTICSNDAQSKELPNFFFVIGIL